MHRDPGPLSPTQRQVLEALKRRGEATADDLAQHLGITPSAVRQHLGSLRSTGLVTSRPVRGQTGRPADLYRGTTLSDPLFATEHDLAVQFLDDISEEQPDLIERLFERRRRRMVDATRAIIDGTPIDERVGILADQLDARGYLADVGESGDGSYVLNLHNCPIWDIADRYRHACEAELGFIQDVLPDADVARAAHKSNECGTCTYQITPRPGVRDAGHRM